MPSQSTIRRQVIRCARTESVRRLSDTFREADLIDACGVRQRLATVTQAGPKASCDPFERPRPPSAAHSPPRRASSDRRSQADRTASLERAPSEKRTRDGSRRDSIATAFLQRPGCPIHSKRTRNSSAVRLETHTAIPCQRSLDSRPYRNASRWSKDRCSKRNSCGTGPPLGAVATNELTQTDNEFPGLLRFVPNLA